MPLFYALDGMTFPVRQEGLLNLEDSLAPLDRVYKDVPQMLLRLIRRNNTPTGLVNKAHREFSF